VKARALCNKSMERTRNGVLAVLSKGQSCCAAKGCAGSEGAHSIFLAASTWKTAVVRFLATTLADTWGEEGGFEGVLVGVACGGGGGGGGGGGRWGREVGEVEEGVG
jgi:hypothetical protein